MSKREPIQLDDIGELLAPKRVEHVEEKPKPAPPPKREPKSEPKPTEQPVKAATTKRKPKKTTPKPPPAPLDEKTSKVLAVPADFADDLKIAVVRVRKWARRRNDIIGSVSESAFMEACIRYGIDHVQKNGADSEIFNYLADVSQRRKGGQDES